MLQCCFVGEGLSIFFPRSSISIVALSLCLSRFIVILIAVISVITYFLVYEEGRWSRGTSRLDPIRV